VPRTSTVGEGAFGGDVKGQACTIPVHGFSVGQKPGGGAVVDADPFFFFFLVEKELDVRPRVEGAGVPLALWPLRRAMEGRRAWCWRRRRPRTDGERSMASRWVPWKRTHQRSRREPQAPPQLVTSPTRRGDVPRAATWTAS
jgi:hypothetical protein